MNKKRICIILPVLSNLNSILYIFIEMLKLNYEIIIITSNQKGYKGTGLLERHEVINELNIYRVADNFTSSKYFISNTKKIYKILSKFKPDIVLFGTWYLYKISKKISKKYNSKLVCLTEFFYTSNRFIGRRKYYLGLPFLIEPVAKFLRHYFLRNIDKIIVSDFTEKKHKNYGCKVEYIPWCNHIPKELEKTNLGFKNRINQVIFAGSLIEITINVKFIDAVEVLLKNNFVDKLVVIGAGPNKYLIDEMIETYPGRIDYRGQLTREEVLNEISLSKFGILTTENGGWGFIGECFAMGTPLLFTTNHYNFRHLVDSFYFRFEEENSLKELNRISNQENEYISIQGNMIKRYNENHSAHGVAKHFDKLFKNV